MKKKLFILAIISILSLTACGDSEKNVQNVKESEHIDSNATKDSYIEADKKVYVIYEYGKYTTSYILDTLTDIVDGGTYADLSEFLASLEVNSSACKDYIDELNSSDYDLIRDNQYGSDYISNIQDYLDIMININNEVSLALNDNDPSHTETVTNENEKIKKLSEQIPELREKYLEDVGFSPSEIGSIIADTETLDEILSNSETITEATNNTGNSISNYNNSSFPKIEELPYNIEILPPDSIGTRYMNCTYTNNSNYPIVSFDMTVLLKDKNDKTFLVSYDTVLQGETSPVFNTFAPDSGQEEDYEILKISYSYMDNNEEKYVYYDAKLKTYENY